MDALGGVPKGEAIWPVQPCVRRSEKIEAKKEREDGAAGENVPCKNSRGRGSSEGIGGE